MTPTFVSHPNLHAFHAQVWDVTRQIPPGKFATYEQIAGLIPPPGDMDPKAYLAFGPRWAGSAMEEMKKWKW
ncbi:MAG: MGMT family protein [Anaerolineales bacterium]|nr:MGMT family protein [Anaerolineales bacterium]